MQGLPGASSSRRPHKPRRVGTGARVGEALRCPDRREVGTEGRIAKDGTECSGPSSWMWVGRGSGFRSRGVY